MGVTVYNISSTSARVNWPALPTCLDTFYSVMYDPNWNSLIMGYKRKSFRHEERIPVTQTSTYLGNLLPQTAYFLCVTCQAADPVREQCQVFSTPGENSEGHDRAGWELAVGVWLTCCLLLLVIAGILMWGCLHNMCYLPGRTPESRPVVTSSVRQDMSSSGHLFAVRSGSEESIKRGAAMQSSLMLAQPAGHVITPEHES
ncbi:fibronectin type III domain-containing protein 9 [Cyprinodon tularosa]|uniref:fibronectin type III domain-containing protein 9 n=1 Tax=Cyprinodon variegatus TaxID=28743 RepID=UPI000742CC60|nr:PREDICTED: fibronectin type III domain-containing protein 9 [Cyprinodon variegatus]XP_038127674.1 fibronectin type III domain-containing protein 9 [Cyprinodon tularosa]